MFDFPSDQYNLNSRTKKLPQGKVSTFDKFFIELNEIYISYLLGMCQRKSWTKMEDRILKLLYEQRGYKKWSDVAETMRTQYGIFGRNGKQCRERYHNHLDENISKAQWTTQEDQQLLKLHNKLGNRWALIAREIKGRTDNCVKNRFYSRFRRSLRNVNELIKVFWKKKFKQLKPNFISKFRKTQDQNKRQIFEACEDLKSRLISYSDSTELQLRQNQQSLSNLFTLIKQINNFNRKNKRKGKKKKVEESDYEEDQEFQNDEQGKMGDQKMNTMTRISLKQMKSLPNSEQAGQIIKQQLKLQLVDDYCELSKNPVTEKTVDIGSLRLGEIQRQFSCFRGIEVNKLEAEAEQMEEKKKKPDTGDLICDKLEDGIDIYEFYDMENISCNRHLYFY